MNRKMIALNVVLVAVVAYAGYLLRNEVQAAKARELAMKNAQAKPAPPPPLVPIPPQQPVLATTYKDVAMKTLFHPSRDPNVPVEPPPPPPPPKPLPALPKYYGTMNLIGEPIVLLAFGNGSSQGFKIGDQVGPFKLVDFNTVDMTFEWEGGIVRRTLDQLQDRKLVASSDSGPSTDGRSLNTPPPAAAVQEMPTPKGPGERWANGRAPCQPNDSTPVGTIQNGLRKVEIGTPFGKACRWDPLGR
jgi:hypothetical protein